MIMADDKKSLLQEYEPIIKKQGEEMIAKKQEERRKRVRKGISWRANKDGTFTIRLTLKEISFLEQILGDATHRAYERTSILDIQNRQLGEEWFEKTRPFYERQMDFAQDCYNLHSTFELFIRYGPDGEPKVDDTQSKEKRE